jgi:hypothetical protein
MLILRWIEKTVFFLANRYTETLASDLGQGVLDVRSKGA